MPFTFAHPAIVLPLGKVSKRWLSLTGLVIGSMAPDFEYFLRLTPFSIYSHTLAGLFWFDLPLGLVLVILYQQLIKDRLINQLPELLFKRLSKFRNAQVNYNLQYFVVLVISLLTGAASHLLWDGFTHPTGYFVQRLPFLRSTISVFHHSVYVYKILQHGSTLIGFSVIILCIFRQPKQTVKRTFRAKNYWLIVYATAFVLLTLRLLITNISLHQYGDWIVTFISGLLLGLIVASIVTPNKTMPQT